jgi:drug/metabolite transporter (DMT)-like permease
MNTNRNWRAASELVFATAIWGFGFTAVIWALKSIDPISLNFIRFATAAVIGLGIGFFIPALRTDINKEQFLLAFAPGALLGLAITIQNWGLMYTTATNSGFITTLYVVFVPIFELLLLRKRIHNLHALWVILALIGTALIVNLQMHSINKGDALTLLTAIFASLQIIIVGSVNRKIKSAFIFNSFQSFWGALLSLPLFLFTGEIRISMPDPLGWIGLFSMIIGSSVLAFSLQIKAQKVLSPSLASILFLLESPFAVLFAVLLLNESMSVLQIAGAALIILASYAATRTETK